MPKTKQFGGKTYYLFNDVVLSSDEADKFAAEWRRKRPPREKIKKVCHFGGKGYVMYCINSILMTVSTLRERKRYAEQRKEPDMITLPPGMPPAFNIT